MEKTENVLGTARILEPVDTVEELNAIDITDMRDGTQVFCDEDGHIYQLDSGEWCYLKPTKEAEELFKDGAMGIAVIDGVHYRLPVLLK